VLYSETLPGHRFDHRNNSACQKYGSHPHPEGWVAFLDNDAGGIEIEFMQVYTAEQLKEYEAYKGI
jgi:methylmalonyl-CoA/ethylmalonyl-CoA epimerase